MNVKAFSFLQWTAESHSYYDELFSNLGLHKVGTNYNKDVIWNVNDVYFFVTTLRHDFLEQHGPGVSGIGLYFDDAQLAYQESIENGMIPAQMMGHTGEGIDGAILHFTDSTVCEEMITTDGPYKIDHITHNCHIGNVDVWAKNYSDWFGMYQDMYFNIDGKETGLISKAMMSHNENMAIPLNEDKNDKGQIAKYLKDFNGEGVQHIALHTDDIYSTVKQLRANGIQFLDTPDTYYDMIDDRIDYHEENIDALRELGILIDGNKEDGILLQIFTKEVVGPVFFEIIQRKGNTGFGHGNFKALFEAIERTQLNIT
jgi:4-hydroxyphenylpyruvate dioxygenase